MSLKDIEKLKERVEKDPNSKLFVPLAEEYKKEGMLDEAINVLLGGIERQPGYMSARVSLGKIYLEKGMMTEARSEFENVIKSIPDNLYAHKKLAEIYRDLGEKSLSINSYRTVLKLNAQDEDAISNLQDLENKRETASTEEVSEVKSGPDSSATASPQEEVAEPPEEEIEIDIVPAPGKTASTLSEEELNAFKDSIFGEKAPAAVEETETGYENEEDAIEIVEDEEDASEDEVSLEDVAEAVVIDPSGRAETLEEPQADPSMSGLDGAGTMGDFSAAHPAEGPTLKEADGLISEGNYLGAINAYRLMLSASPEDKAILQRMEDLKVLLKLMGKDKESLIERLEDFLEGIQKRRDEFHHSS